MKKLLLCVGLSVLVFSGIMAQEKEKQLKFSESVYDFYSVKEEKGTVTHDFLITNLGENNVKIIGIDTKSKALKAEWSQNVLKKYDKIHFKVTLNPKGMKYSFKIPMSVITLAGKNDTVIYNLMLRGYVIPTPTTKEEIYSMMEGHLKYITNSKDLGHLNRHQVVRDTFRFYNVWDSTMTFKAGRIPPAIKIVYLTPSLESKKEGMVVYDYHAEVKNDWGSVYDQFTLITNDPLPERNKKPRIIKTFYVLCEIYDDFSTLTKKELAEAPHILVDSEEYNFGSCTMGDRIIHNFRIRNIGKSPLIVHKVKTSCGCTTSKLEKDTLQAGEYTDIKAIFGTAGKKGGQAKEIYVITNDPDQPKVTLKIIGDVKPRQ